MGGGGGGMNYLFSLNSKEISKMHFGPTVVFCYQVLQIYVLVEFSGSEHQQKGIFGDFSSIPSTSVYCLGHLVV